MKKSTNPLRVWYSTLLISAGLLMLIVSSLVKADAQALTEEQTPVATAVFAGGCFWCVESNFEEHEGVIEAVSGYTGGEVMNPSYRQVASGQTGHREVVQVSYDPSKLSYEALLAIFWQLHDPSDPDGSFVDRGFQYSSAIYYADDTQKQLAEASKNALERSGIFDRPVATEIVALNTFYAAEDYHQDYYKKNPVRYKFYRFNSGRDQFIARIWGKKGHEEVLELLAEHMSDTQSVMTPQQVPTQQVPAQQVPTHQGIGITPAADLSPDTDDEMVTQAGAGSAATELSQSQTPQRAMVSEGMEDKLMNFQKPTEAELRAALTPLQYRVTQEEGTERAFNNEYWDNHHEGIYVDIVSGEPLFSSTHKFESGTGWPSFYDVLEPTNITEHTDRKLWMVRTEVRSKYADSHLGHLFNDGPSPTGLRYCINSAALRFVPKESLTEEGYEDYLSLFN